MYFAKVGSSFASRDGDRFSNREQERFGGSSCAIIVLVSFLIIKKLLKYILQVVYSILLHGL